MTLDSTNYPSGWTPNSIITSIFYNLGNLTTHLGNSTYAGYQGIWALQYDDDYYGGNTSVNPAYATLLSDVFANASQHVSLVAVAGPHTTLPVAGAVTINGGGVITGIALGTAGTGLQAVLVKITGTGTYACAVAKVVSGSVASYAILASAAGWSGTPTVTVTPVAMAAGVVTAQFNINFTTENIGGKMVLALNLASDADGAQHCHNPAVFAPGNTANRSNPLATDDNVVAALTKNGNGPGVLRFMQAIGGSVDANCVDVGDISPPGTYSWQDYRSWNGNVLPECPNSPTFSGTCTAGSVTISGIANTSTLATGHSIIGNGIPGFAPYNTTKIASIVDANNITISANATISGVQTLSYNPWPSGTVVFVAARPYYTNPAQAGIAWTPSGKVYSSENWTISGTDSFGPYTGASRGGPYGRHRQWKLLDPGPEWPQKGVLELRSATPHGLNTGQFPANYIPSQTFTATTVNGSSTVTLSTAVAGLHVFVGQMISGA